MMDLHFMEDSQWKKLVAIHFKSYFDDDKAAVAVEQVRVEAEKMMEIPEEEEMKTMILKNFVTVHLLLPMVLKCCCIIIK